MELRARTPAGARYVEMMERHAADFATGAAELDRRGVFAAENIEAMARSGVLAAAVPESLGGLGVESYHDLALGSSRLARGEASTAIATWMHLVATRMMAAPYSAFVQRGMADRVQRLEEVLRGVVEDRDVIAVLGSEPGTYVSHPQTTAEYRDGGFILNGTKIFATLSQGATLLNVAVKVRMPDGTVQQGFALVPSGTAGVTVNDDWDALGMRASGSGSVQLKDVRVPTDAVSQLSPYGEENAASIFARLGRNCGLLGACLGIAEAAREQAVLAATSKRKQPSGKRGAERFAIQQLMGELDVTLNSARASFSHACQAVDDAHARLTPRDVRLEEMRALDVLVESAKVTLERGCRDVVDRAMAISGGGGYMSRSPLSRHYRDVRALGFMYPQATETLQMIGMVGLNRPVELDL